MSIYATYYIIYFAIYARLISLDSCDSIGIACEMNAVELAYLLELGHLFLREHREDTGSAALSLAAAAAACSGGAGILRCCCRGWCLLFYRRRLGFRSRCLLLLLGLLLLLLIRLEYHKYRNIFSDSFRGWRKLHFKHIENIFQCLLILRGEIKG